MASGQITSVCSCTNEMKKLEALTMDAPIRDITSCGSATRLASSSMPPSMPPRNTLMKPHMRKYTPILRSILLLKKESAWNSVSAYSACGMATVCQTVRSSAGSAAEVISWKSTLPGSVCRPVEPQYQLLLLLLSVSAPFHGVLQSARLMFEMAAENMPAGNRTTIRSIGAAMARRRYRLGPVLHSAFQLMSSGPGAGWVLKMWPSSGWMTDCAATVAENWS
mmetsp:Transcript_16338/g.41837  ORF Transcript_16338/g.41837 Transcript_16338/m.41837 type:complete len:222 (-) Transcript_16338:559-1224(-)